MTCLFDPVSCVYTVATGWIAAVPWGWFVGGIVLGALLGRYFAAIVIVAALYFARYRPRPAVPSKDIWPHPDDSPRPSRPTIFGKRK